MPNTLPHDFPCVLTVTLMDDTHKGQRQLSAPFAHAGRLYKVVISYSRDRSRVCQPGETWVVELHNSPNGRIVFCRPNYRVTEEGGGRSTRQSRRLSTSTDDDEEALGKFREWFEERFF